MRWREPAGLLAAGVLMLALFVDGGGGPGVAPPWDKVMHFGYFGLLAAALWMGLGAHRPWQVLALVAGVGLADEWRQLYLPARQASAGDFLADLLGAGTALLILGCRPRRDGAARSS